MTLKKRYTFLLLPEDGGNSSTFVLRRSWIVMGLGLVLVGLGVAALYSLDVARGVAWRPGGSSLERENERLQVQLAGVETQMTRLENDLAEVWRYQELVAAAADLEVPAPEVREAGIGGREPLASSVQELAGLAGHQPHDLDQLLRQARIQRRGLAAMLDSLESRSEVRDHLPSIRPCDVGWFSSRYGMRQDPFTGKQAFHRGIDFSLPVGSDVRVTAAGVVVKIEKQKGLGLVIKIDHGQGVMTVYAHLHKARVKKGDRVPRGQVIAQSGNSGRSTAPHLHYEVRVNGRAVNPLSYILDSYADRS